MTLEFPTMAERCLAEWRAATVTVALEVVAKRYDAIKERKNDFETRETRYTFPDDTSLTVYGKGISHRVEVHLP